MQYLLLIQGNTKAAPTVEEWERFFEAVRGAGVLRGGSELGARVVVGDETSAQSTAHVVGYMRFDSDDRDSLVELLKQHPVVLHGGSVELCEMPKS